MSSASVPGYGLHHASDNMSKLLTPLRKDKLITSGSTHKGSTTDQASKVKDTLVYCYHCYLYVKTDKSAD